MRTPQSLEQAFCYFTECQLATLEYLICRRSTPKSEIRRHYHIANAMVENVKTFVSQTELDRPGNPRLLTILSRPDLTLAQHMQIEDPTK